ncbi:MAG: hypothetical protein WCG26_10900, partial [Chloroflexales bacterium]
TEINKKLPGATGDERKLLLLEKQQMGLKRQISVQTQAKDAETKAAQEKIKAAQEEEKKRKEALAIQQAQLQVQTESVSMAKQQVAVLTKLAQAMQQQAEAEKKNKVDDSQTEIGKMQKRVGDLVKRIKDARDAGARMFGPWLTGTEEADKGLKKVGTQFTAVERGMMAFARASGLDILMGTVKYLATGKADNAMQRIFAPGSATGEQLLALRYKFVQFGIDAKNAVTAVGASLMYLVTGRSQGIETLYRILGKDNPFVLWVTNARKHIFAFGGQFLDVTRSVRNAIVMAFSGKFTGGIFGLTESSTLVRGLRLVHMLLEGVWWAIGQVTSRLANVGNAFTAGMGNGGGLTGGLRAGFDALFAGIPILNRIPALLGGIGAANTRLSAGMRSLIGGSLDTAITKLTTFAQIVRLTYAESGGGVPGALTGIARGLQELVSGVPILNQVIPLITRLVNAFRFGAAEGGLGMGIASVVLAIGNGNPIFTAAAVVVLRVADAFKSLVSIGALLLTGKPNEWAVRTIEGGDGIVRVFLRLRQTVVDFARTLVKDGPIAAFAQMRAEMTTLLPELWAWGTAHVRAWLDSLFALIPASIRDKIVRLGGVIVGAFAALGIAPMIAGLFTGGAGLFAPLLAALTPLGAALANVGPLVLRFFTSFGPTVLSLFTRIGPLLLNVGKLILGLTSPVGIIITLIGLFAGAWTTNFGGIRQVTEMMLGPVLPILKQLGDMFGMVLGYLMQGDWRSALDTLGFGFSRLGTLFAPLAASLQTGLPA